MICIDDLIGVPYKVNGRDKEGFDCYGLAIEVEKRFGNNLPDFDESRSDNKNFVNCRDICLELVKKLKPVSEPTKEGDIILFEDKNGVMFHIGVYLGNGQYIHCNKYRVHIDRVGHGAKIGGVYTWQ